MTAYWMPLLLACFGGFMLSASLQHFIAGFRFTNPDRSHIIFSLWAFLVFLLSAGNLGYYFDISYEQYFFLGRIQSVLSILITLFFLLFSISILKIKVGFLIRLLVLSQIFLAVWILLNPDSGFNAASGLIQRRDSGLMAGRLMSVDPVFLWEMYAFSAFVMMNFPVAIYGAARVFFIGENVRMALLFLVPLLIYFSCVVGESVIYANTGELSNISLIGIGSMVLFMGGMLTSAAREREAMAVSVELERRVDERTKHLEQVMMSLESEMLEKERLAEQLLKAKQMEGLGQLAGGFAHDFNNVLTAVRGYGELALDEAVPSSDLHLYVKQIIHASDRANELTQQLLGVARRQRTSLIPCRLDGLVSQYLHDHPLSPAQGIHVAVAAEDIAPVMIDVHQFGQVLGHLIANACDAMPAGGSISIRLENCRFPLDDIASESEEHLTNVQAGDYVRLSVSDSGIGMDASAMAHAFEPFFSTKATGGSGLGLAVCYGIVKQNRGYIFLSSKLGEGCRVDVYFRAGDIASP